MSEALIYAEAGDEIPDQVHFLWPAGSGPLVEPTEADKLAELERMKASLAAVVREFAATRIGSIRVIWRQEPTWNEERRYEDRCRYGWISARAVVVAEPLVIRLT